MSHSTMHRLRQRLAQQDVMQLFDCADVDGTGELSLADFKAAFATDADVDVVQQFFEELDINQDGKVSLQEFKAGLVSVKVSLQEFKEGLVSVPVTDNLDVLKGLLHSLNLRDLIATHLMAIIRLRMQEGEEMTTDAVRRHMRSEDITTVLQVCVRIGVCQLYV